jgi:hypothetical protein
MYTFGTALRYPKVPLLSRVPEVMSLANLPRLSDSHLLLNLESQSVKYVVTTL